MWPVRNGKGGTHGGGALHEVAARIELVFCIID
jgi:hypothetical protein